MKRRARWLLACLVLGSLGAATGQPTEDQGGEEELSAVEALIDVERSLLEADRGRYETLVRQRSEIAARLVQLRGALDAAVREDEVDPRRLTQLADELTGAEAERDVLAAAERALVERIAERLQRLELFAEQLETQRRQERPAEGLTGTWDLVLMPINQGGTCVLRQTGAVVSGTYRLEGGWTGSLQGTLINRKVFLVRIDSKMGKSMEFEGYLSGDGERIRGSWLNYELAGSEGSTGQWTARRRSDAP